MSLALPLDTVSTTNCYGAFSVTRLSTSYTGPTLTIRRGSDNVTSDFYADAYGNLGTTVNGTGATLESWLAGANGYVTKWWDQSGKGFHATQSTTASQPRIDFQNIRLDFAGSTCFSLPNGTVPLGRTYTFSGSYVSTSSSVRTTLITDNNNLENIYDTAMTASITMNGAYVGVDRAATYLNGSRTAILNNEFSAIYRFYDGTYSKAVRLVFRKNGDLIDCYQSQGLYWTGTIAEYNAATISDPNVAMGSAGYGAVAISITGATPYTVTVKHNTIATTGVWLGGGGTSGSSMTNNFRRDTNQYYNYWYGNDFQGTTGTYQPGNTVTYAYDGNYSSMYINGTAQGTSPQRSGWNAPAGNEFIGRNQWGTEYFNGEMYFLYIFKSFLATNDRLTIERAYSTQPSALSNGIRFSQLKQLTNSTNSTTFSLSQANTYGLIGAGGYANLSSYDGFTLKPGLFMRIYWTRYFGNDPTWFNANTPDVTGVTTNLKNTYCATGGFNNPNTSDTAVGGLAAVLNYSVEWTGVFYAPVTGTYTFYLASDDSSYFWIGSTATSGYTTANALINNYFTGPAEKSATISLTAGTYYPFRLQFGDGGGGEFVTFSFVPPGFDRIYEGTGYFFCQASTHSLYTIPTTNLGLYLPFESSDVSGTTVRSRVPGANTTTTLVGGATVSTADSKVGASSLALTATSSQYLQIPSFTTTTNGLTFSCWYRSNGSGTWARIFDFGNGANNNNVLLSPNVNTGNLGLSVVGIPNDLPYYLTDINYNDNVWRHITWTLTYAAENTASSTWIVYVNGVSKATISSRYYPATTVTRTANYLGKSNWADAYYNGYIDDFRVYHRVVTAAEAASLYSNSTANYILKNGSASMITQVQGTTPKNPATSGYALYACNPWLPNGTYWIKSATMPNALPMYVDVKRGGYDFYQITGGTSVSDITATHSGTALGLELMIPRSQAHWRAIYDYVYNTLGSTYTTWLTAIPIYRTTTTVSAGNYSSSGANLAMFDPRYGNSGYLTGSYNGAVDWTCKDGGLWYLKEVPFGEPNGNYITNAFLMTYSASTYPQWVSAHGCPGFDDANSIPSTGTSYLVSTNYAGSTVSTLTVYYDGRTRERAAPSALYIKNMTGTSTNGVYWINLPTVGPTQIYCIMDSTVDGGGWMMAMKATRGTTFSFGSTHWTTVTTLNPSDYTRGDADAKFHTMNYFPSKDLLALWPDIPYNYNSGTGGNLSLSGYNNWAWMKNNYNSGAKQTLINYFATVNNVSYGTPKGVERGTAFSSQAGNAFYGANFTSNTQGQVRWGLAWNNEGDWASNDVYGGIGMYAGSYSAGDYIGCCQDQTGINRSARVEMYVR